VSEILAAILEPLGKVLLEIWLAHAIDKISSKRRADIARRARELAAAVSSDLESALGREA